jgi:drug/metabolite transporter (DMT)-like permease
MEPFYILSTRFALAIAMFFILIQLFKKNTEKRKIPISQLFIGMLVHGAYLGGVFFSIDRGMPAGIVSIIVGLQPIITIIMSKYLFNERITPYQNIGFFLGLIGMFFVIYGKYGFSNSIVPISAFIASIVALFGISLGTVLQKKLGNGLPILSSSIYQYLGALFVVVTLSFSLEDHVVKYSRELIFSISWLVLALSVIAILLLMYMIREGETANVASYFYLVPPVTVIQTWFLFNEKLSLISLVGCGLSIIGVYLVLKKELKLKRIRVNKIYKGARK